jgi:multidrug efflux pump subunit AcrB
MKTIAWFARNPVAANLLAALIIVGGAISLISVRQEVFPEFSLDLITISVEYLGAAPEEVEEGVNVRLEEAIQGLDGVKKITSVASEGIGIVSVELLLEADSGRVLDDVKARVDAIDTFPAETEKPVIRELTNRRQVIGVAVSGSTDEGSLRHLSEQVRDELTALPEITLVELASVRPFEVSIDVSEATLRRWNLTFDHVAEAVRRSSLDLPGGSVKTAGGEILLRTKGQAHRAAQFEQLVVLTRPDGTHLRLGEIATIRDGFAETDQFARFDNEPTALVQVYRVGEQDALSIAGAVADYIVEAQPRMPEGVKLTAWNDAARVLRGRRDLLMTNGAFGLALVFLTLGMFLRFRLALWTAIGLAIAFMGALWVMPALDVSINVISLFAFILVLGIVVDDAIVVGENIHTHQHRLDKGLDGAISGAQEVALPVVFAVLTTVAAFLPLLNVAGTTGKVMRVIPLIVIPCLIWSLVESMWILPAHLAHYRKKQDRDAGRGVAGIWRRFQSRFSDGLEAFVQRFYRPMLGRALEWRYLTLSIGLAVLFVTVGLVRGEYVRFFFFPTVESDFVSAALTLPPGTPPEVTSDAVRQLEEAALRVEEEVTAELGGDSPFQHFLGAIGEHPFRVDQQRNAGGVTRRDVFSHLGEVTIELLPAEERTVSSAELAARWRKETGPIPDAVELDYTASLFSPGDDIDVQLTGTDIEDLRAVADELKAALAEFAGVFEISDSFRSGKRELELAIRPEAEVLGLTLADLGRQVRQAFYGEEAQRIQRGRDDVRVMVRYPVAERRSLSDLEQMRIRTPDGREIPFSEVARVVPGRGFASITRVDRRRAIHVTADVDSAQATPGGIVEQLGSTILPDLLARYPGVNYTFEGQQAEQRETLGGLIRGFVVALVLIYGLLAVPLRSYGQPLVIMAAIPFGFVGAVWGHVITGLDLTILSMFGLVALTGVVVNDSLVLVDYINRFRSHGRSLSMALTFAGMARFRPIVLTSVTTFAGLAPLMLEKSMQARFLIPMAVSLAFGVLFATLITLVLVPCGYLIMEDVKFLFTGRRGEEASSGTAETDDGTTATGSEAA